MCNVKQFCPTETKDPNKVQVETRELRSLLIQVLFLVVRSILRIYMYSRRRPQWL